MLVRLQAYFRSPVMPIERYCAHLRTWQRAMDERAYDLKTELFPDMMDHSDRAKCEAGYKQYQAELANPPAERRHDIDQLKRYEATSDQINYVFLQITKSALLARLIYDGEKLRSTKCPLHKGHWSGLEFGSNVCPHGCQLTGWIPEP